MSLFPPGISTRHELEWGRATNIELVKGSETHDDVRRCALCLDMAEEYREADEDVDEDHIGRR